jgi:hypothetical protein
MKKILKLTVFSAVLLMLAGGLTFCVKDKNKICNVKEPIKNLLWLKYWTDFWIENKIPFEIYQCTYKDNFGKEKFGFFIDSFDATSLHDCAGTTLCGSGPEDLPDCWSYEIKNKKLILKNPK